MGCKKEPSYFDICPEEVIHGYEHYLEVPFTVHPHQAIYSVGDTISFESSFTDSIYDITRDVRFKIQDFPFGPMPALYKINNSTWDSGYDHCELIVEDRFNPSFINTIRFGKYFPGEVIYLDSSYLFKYQIVLNSAGRYCTIIADVYNENGGGSSSGKDANVVANEIEFEGKCPVFFNICNRIVGGDPHFDDFIDELQLLDREVFSNNLGSISDTYREHLDSGSRKIEWNGVFCFEVAE